MSVSVVWFVVWRYWIGCNYDVVIFIFVLVLMRFRNRK